MRAFLAGLAAFVVMDAIWLGVVATDFYRRELGPIARTASDGSLAPLWPAAIPVYLLVVLGVFWFVRPRAAGAGLVTAARWGALFGVMTFGVYDLTNLAILRDFSVTVALVDMVWGGVVCATVAVAMQLATSGNRRGLRDAG